MQAANPRKGYILGLSAYVIWGLFPLYFKAIASVPAAEIIVHRVLWSALFGTKLADEWYRLHTGGDLAFFNGVLKHLIDNGGDGKSYPVLPTGRERYPQILVVQFYPKAGIEGMRE